MSNCRLRHRLIIILAIFIFGATACSKKEEPVAQESVPESVSESIGANFVELPAEDDEQDVTDELSKESDAAANEAVITVNGISYLKKDLRTSVRKKMNQQKERIPADQRRAFEDGLRKQLIEHFVMKTLLSQEAGRLGILATENEIQHEMRQMQENLPQGKALDDFLKENDVTKDDIALGIRIKKMIKAELGTDANPSEEDIRQFYAEHKDRFATQESVHVRHILIAIHPDDDVDTRALKKERIQKLHTELQKGADFAQLAKENSDCPSRDRGGDLGVILRDQTIKPFENAAFTQKPKVIGPVVSTEYGHHIIEVLEYKPAHIMPLSEVKDRISAYLKQEREIETFTEMMERLEQTASIVYHEKL